MGTGFFVKWFNCAGYSGLYICTKTEGVGARMTKTAGRVNTRSRSRLGRCAEKLSVPSVGKPSCDGIAHLSVRYQAAKENCVPFSLLTVLKPQTTDQVGWDRTGWNKASKIGSVDRLTIR